MTNYAKNIENDKNNKLKISDSKILLQIGAFNKIENANKLLDFLKSKINDNLFLQDFKKESKINLYKLFAGPFNSDNEANIVAEKLLDLGFSTIYKKQ